jgi:hypothetical protein
MFSFYDVSHDFKDVNLGKHVLISSVNGHLGSIGAKAKVKKDGVSIDLAAILGLGIDVELKKRWSGSSGSW